MNDYRLIDKHAHSDGTTTEWRFELLGGKYAIHVSEILDAPAAPSLPQQLHAVLGTGAPHPTPLLMPVPPPGHTPPEPAPEPEPTGELISISATVCEECRETHAIDRIAGWPLTEDHEVVFERMLRILAWRLGAATEAVTAAPTKH